MAERIMLGVSEAYENKLHKVRKRVAREARAKIKEFRAKYGIKKMVHDCREPGPSKKPTKLYFKIVQEDSEWWFATYSEKSIPAEVHKLLSHLESFVSFNREETPELMSMMQDEADEPDWIIGTGLIHEGDLVDDERVARQTLVKEASVPVMDAIKEHMRRVDINLRPEVRELVKSQLQGVD